MKFGTPIQSDKSSLPPVVPSSPEIKVRTMKSDIESLLKAGHVAHPGATMLRVPVEPGLGLGPTPSAPKISPKTKQAIIISFLILSFVLVAGFVVYYFVLPIVGISE